MRKNMSVSKKSQLPSRINDISADHMIDDSMGHDGNNQFDISTGPDKFNETMKEPLQSSLLPMTA